ncbi:GNAT family N-acetyltransferase [Bdellovibrio sp. 22V]|uniref:GNAT family N-acetyltransferase n=1 Tax=Bdellovibrio sp. 22V TaxID=3044166 RepID=UPI00254320CC|nr:GNAT family N-acetyltransferase [Bdellovibrio sp. 22V]WII71846.1 GNAT family N-acetyltransferase [Bdellovibrio sp. 22V]
MTWSLTPSPLESERFGIRAGKLTVQSTKDIPEALSKAKDLNLNFISARVETQNISLVQELEFAGFFLTDTLVYYRKKITENSVFNLSKKDYVVRLATESDYEQISKVSSLAFKGYIGHYHADPRLSKEKADEVYVDWVKRSCHEKFLADAIYVTEENGQITSFATMKKEGSTAEGVLFGVHPEHQGKGIYRELIVASMIWAQKNACDEIKYSTQINNVAVQKVWTREGCEIHNSYYTFHYWADK